MEGQIRGRSPSVGRQNNQNIRHSPSPHNFATQGSHSEYNPAHQTFTQPYPGGDISPSTVGDINFDIFNSNLDTGAQQPFQQSLDSFDQPFQTNELDVNPGSLDAQGNQSFQSEMLNVDTRFRAFPHQQGFNKQELIIDPQLQAGGPLSSQAINPQDIMSNMSSPNNLAPTPPFVRQHSEPGSPYAQSPQSQRQQSPHHSRNASLDPTSAFGNGQQEWNGMMAGAQFTSHRRAPSEYSDVSSNAPSPFVNQSEVFEQIDHNHSPLMNPQQADPQLYPDGLGLDAVKLSDHQQRTSPRHSPFVSPRMTPQVGLGPVDDVSFIGLPQKQENFGGPLPETYGAPLLERFPSVQPEQRLGSNDFGRADQFDVPQINVETAPNPQLQNMDNRRNPTDIDALSPPERGMFVAMQSLCTC